MLRYYGQVWQKQIEKINDMIITALHYFLLKDKTELSPAQREEL
jgi:hypothetical protein